MKELETIAKPDVAMPIMYTSYDHDCQGRDVDMAKCQQNMRQTRLHARSRRSSSCLLSHPAQSKHHVCVCIFVMCVSLLSANRATGSSNGRAPICWGHPKPHISNGESPYSWGHPKPRLLKRQSTLCWGHPKPQFRPSTTALVQVPRGWVILQQS